MKSLRHYQVRALIRDKILYDADDLVYPARASAYIRHLVGDHVRNPVRAQATDQVRESIIAQLFEDLGE